MKAFPNYTQVEPLEETLDFRTCRARKPGGDGTVILKMLKAGRPSLSETARLKHEYERIRRVRHPGIIKVVEILESEGATTLTLVLEDHGGTPLKGLLGGRLPIERFLGFAIRLADILEALHRHDVCHGNIKPASILLNPDTDDIKLTDFGVATELATKEETFFQPRFIEERLAYISPEQTGRANCAVDHRADLYSLGVTFYEMLTGLAPFISRDPVELLHDQLMRMPVPPEKLNASIPGMVSEIIMKLMAKAPEKRYQSSRGLKADLMECRSRLKITGRIEPFTTGRNDIPSRFTLPQALVGREAELKTLTKSLERVSRGSVEVMLITGEPGIGKSSLVGEIQKPVAAKHGYFIAGKYDQLRRFVPYSSVIQAFQHLSRQLLFESEDRRRYWKEKLTAALGSSAKVITDIIPEIGLITGPQPDVPKLGPEETRNRFKLAFKRFVRVFAGHDHPLVLFLDDLQWADPASLDLIQTLVADRDLRFFLFIGAYRDNKAAAHQPLLLALDMMRETRIEVTTLELDVLSKERVNALLAGFFCCEPAASASLAAAVHAKARGNPFFINQFLQFLYEEKHLLLDPDAGWQWQVDAIRKAEVPDRMVEFMAARISRLPKDWRDLLKVCACVGNRFDIETLAAAMECPLQELLHSMDELYRLGLIHYTGNLYRFHHDLIHEAAYSLISPAKKESLHYKIGRRLMEMTPPEELTAKVFYIADQYNQAKGLIQTRHKRAALVDLNLKAGLKARDSTAYAAAAEYFRTGMEFLPEEAWQAHYELTYTLYAERMRCEYLARNFEESEALFAEIIRNTKGKVKRARVCMTMIALYTNMGKIKEAIELGIKSARIFDVHLPWNPGRWAVLRELILFRIKTRKRKLKDILDMPLIKNQEKLWSTELISSIGLPAYYVDNNLFSLAILKGMNIGSDYGLPPASGFGNAALAVIIGSKFGKYRIARRLGEIALQLDEKLGQKRFSCKTCFVFAFMVLPWTTHLRDCLPYYRKAYQFGLDTGDFIYCGHCITSAGISRIIMGDPVDEVLADHQRHKDFIESVRDPLVSSLYAEITQMLLNLKGLTDSPFSLDTPDYSHEERLNARKEMGCVLYVFYGLLARERINCLYGRHEEAGQIGNEMDAMQEISTGSFMLAEHVFYRSLSLLAVYPEQTPWRKRRIRALLKPHRKKLKQWAASAPANYLSRHLLIEAEHAAVRNRPREAIVLFERAIQSARENGYTNIEAMASERAALFCLSREDRAAGRGYMESAYLAYQRWGAAAKLAHLEECYPALLIADASRETAGT